MPGYSAFPTLLLGDLHGNRVLLVRALTELGLLDADGHWIGGGRRLIQVGDLVDRGPEPLGTIELMMRLQQEARAAGGEIICLLGNHELYALKAAAGDHEARIGWTYNGAGADLLEWAARRSEAADPMLMPYPEAFYAEFGPSGAYGQWLRSLPVACRAGDYVAVHAGWTPDGPGSVEEANALPADHPSLHGLVWARRQPEAEIAAACERLGCKGLIAGHTVQTGILSSCGGRLIQIDVGMYHYGTWAAVGLDEAGAPWALVEGAEPVAITGDGLVPVPRPEPEAAAASAPEPRYSPGAVVRVYEAADGSYRQYMSIEGFGEMHGLAAYTGKLLTFAGGVWSTRPSTYFCQRVDQFARPAEPNCIPEI
ncbi:MAG TPA: metallophosphoesterase [Symbiobacteriaceae bacterium]|nr:metallophosphoesterase [Symbiobacteriaceae bacterium]